MRVVVNIGDGVEPLKAKEVQYLGLDHDYETVIGARRGGGRRL